jgi:hypothetical protein
MGMTLQRIPESGIPELNQASWTAAIMVRPGSIFWTQYHRGLVGRSVGALRAARGLYAGHCCTDVDAKEKHP